MVHLFSRCLLTAAHWRNNVPQGWKTLVDTREFEILRWWGFGMVESKKTVQRLFVVVQLLLCVVVVFSCIFWLLNRYQLRNFYIFPHPQYLRKAVWFIVTTLLFLVVPFSSTCACVFLHAVPEATEVAIKQDAVVGMRCTFIPY